MSERRAPLGRACLAMQLSLLALVAALVMTGCADGGSKLDAAGDGPRPDLYFYPLDITGTTDGTVPQWPDLGPPVADGWSPGDSLPAPFLLDFEQNDGFLIGSGDWEWGQLAFSAGANCGTSSIQPPLAGHSGSGVWGTKLNDCHNPLDNAKDACSNQSTSDDSILILKATIPGVWSKATLVYWSWDDYFLPFDWSEVRINGEVAKQVCTGQKAETVLWSRQELDLSTHIGKTVTIAFHFMATGGVNHSGWYLDDISISGQ